MNMQITLLVNIVTKTDRAFKGDIKLHYTQNISDTTIHTDHFLLYASFIRSHRFFNDVLYDSYVDRQTDSQYSFVKRTIVTYVTCHKYFKDCMTKYLTHIYVKCIMFVFFRIDFGY